MYLHDFFLSCGVYCRQMSGCLPYMLRLLFLSVKCGWWCGTSPQAWCKIRKPGTFSCLENRIKIRRRCQMSKFCMNFYLV